MAEQAIEQIEETAVVELNEAEVDAVAGGSGTLSPF